ncbi:MAG: hypothetical protein KKC20_01845 [Proteobacteria bacterium]|nr:hypothetical protein [Pseudomonadota bacterium]
MKARIIAYTGSHGVGKTDAALRAAADLKRANTGKSVKAFCDIEGGCPYFINRDTTRKAQMWLFTDRIRLELEVLARFDLLVTDRTVVDVAAYTYVAGFEDLATDMLALAGHHLAIYKEIRFKSILNNSFCFDDGIRDAVDQDFREKVEKVLVDMYAQLRGCGQMPGDFIHD